MTEKGEREVVHEVDFQAQLLTGDAAGLATTDSREVGKEGEAEVEMHGAAEAMTDRKEHVDLPVGIEEGQKAGIKSPISTGAKVRTENKTENPRRKQKRGDLMTKK
ncbi:hypothetical protein H920_11712 [Fukomys damarensis]|uniref:Uncharacterized protein n=1 Tax=Fukomys damarensis TaxID=885580 RepID=A0A091D9E4_FUKDA|nr:hypothetical protein H920_11712 [Fukomys damarensis]